MSELTHTSPLALRAESASEMASRAPSHADLMRELGVRPKPGWTAKLPPSLASFLTNGKGMAGVIILLIMILTSIAAPLLSDYNPNRRAGKPHVHPGYEHVLGTTRLGKDVFTQLGYGGRVSLSVRIGGGAVAAPGGPPR